MTSLTAGMGRSADANVGEIIKSCNGQGKGAFTCEGATNINRIYNSCLGSSSCANANNIVSIIDS